jgi:hypothetical protein
MGARRLKQGGKSRNEQASGRKGTLQSWLAKNLQLDVACERARLQSCRRFHREIWGFSPAGRSACVPSDGFPIAPPPASPSSSSLAGCKPVGPNYNRPGYRAARLQRDRRVHGRGPTAQSGRTAAGSRPTPPTACCKGKWWEIYQDPQLNQLEERIATNNQGLRQALETYLAARDQVKVGPFRVCFPRFRPTSVTRDKNSANRPLASNHVTNYNDL